MSEEPTKKWTLEEIKALKAKNAEITIEGKFVVIWLAEHNRIKRLFVDTGEGYKELPVKKMIKECAEYIAENIDIVKMLSSRFASMFPEGLVDLHERVKAKPTIVEKPHCYILKIGGKKGQPMELPLFD